MKRGAGKVFADHSAPCGKRKKFVTEGEQCTQTTDYSILKLLESLNSGNYGRVTKEVGALVAQKLEMLDSLMSLEIADDLLTNHLPADGQKGSKLSAEETDEVHRVKDKGLYLGVEDELSDSDPTAEDEGFSYIWKEMKFALESSKDVPLDQSSDEHSEDDEEGCDHSFFLKDDLGYVCRVCGVIQRAIETIFEYQYIKAARIRSYRSESFHSKGNEANLGRFKVKAV